MGAQYLGRFHGFERALTVLTDRLGYVPTDPGADWATGGMVRLASGRGVVLVLWPMPDVPPLPLMSDEMVYAAIVEGDAPEAARVDDLRRVLFAAEPLDERLARLNPACAASPAGLFAPSSRQRLKLLVREHLLLEKVNIVDGLLRAGLRPDEVVFVSKPDRSLYRERVSQALARRGVAVLGTVESALAHLRATPPLPLVVIDDGGDLALMLHRAGLLVPGSRVAETTAKGAALLDVRAPELRFTDLANCSVKRDMSMAIAASCIFRLRALMKHEPLEGRRCLVVGYGEIGRQAAMLLRSLGIEVSLRETSPARAALARQEGFETVASLGGALRREVWALVLGCTGRASLRLADFAFAAQREITLAAVSSNDFKALIADLRAHSYTETVSDWHGTRFVAPDGRRFLVLAHGDSVNLFHDEGVSEPEFDPFNAQILATALDLGRQVLPGAEPRQPSCPGCEVACDSGCLTQAGRIACVGCAAVARPLLDQHTTQERGANSL